MAVNTERRVADLLEAESGSWFTVPMLMAELEHRGAGVSDRSVYRAVGLLVAAGLVERRTVDVMFGQANGGARPREVWEVTAA